MPIHIRHPDKNTTSVQPADTSRVSLEAASFWKAAYADKANLLWGLMRIHIYNVSWAGAPPTTLNRGIRVAMVGTCKLCGESGVVLRDSHLLPKAGYRLLTKSQDGDAPIVMNSKVAIAKDEQVRGHVFCATCEDLLNKNGEAWTLTRISHEVGIVK